MSAQETRNENEVSIKPVDKTNWDDSEAYPVDPDSPSYRFMGFVPTYEREGFHYAKDAGTRRHVMTCKL